MAKRLLCFLMVIIMILPLLSCDNGINEAKGGNEKKNGENVSESYPFTITDDTGTEIVIEAVPKKIASGSPSNTEIIYALGKENILYGVTSYCNYPEEASKKDITGDYNGPNIEKIIQSGIEIYIADWIDEDIRKQLNDAGVKTIIIAPSTYEAIYDRINLLGKILGATNEASELVNSMKNKTQSIIDKVHGSKNRRVFFENWHDPLSSVGPGSFIDEMITMLGSENIAKDMNTSYGEFNPELVIERDPEVYLTTDDGFKTAEDIKARTGFGDITAIKNNQIYFLNPDTTSRPGPRIVEALEDIAKAIYPEEFK